MSKNNILNIPLSIPYLNGNEWKYVRQCLDTGWVSSAGGFIKKFEDACRRYVKAKHSVACINGTCGLHIALKLCGVKEGDEVIVPTLTFIAPVNAVKYLGAEPVFMDCDEHLNLDVDKLDDFCKKECIVTSGGLKNKKTGRIVKAITCVHVFGNPCDMESIMRIAKKYRLKVIEDAAESFGSYYTSGIYKNRFTGTIGDIGVYSFNGNKIITTGGGGLVITENKAIAEKARYLVSQAKDDSIKYIHNEVGYNFRLSNLQAAMGLAQLEQMNDFLRTKKINYYLYKELLKDVRGVRIMDIPERTRPNYWLYSIVIEKERYGISRDQLIERFSEKGIQTRPIWYPNHLQRPYRKNQAYKIETALWFWKRTVNIPSSSNLKKADIEKVVMAIKNMAGRRCTN